MKLINKKTFKTIEINEDKISEHSHNDWAIIDIDIEEETYLISSLNYKKGDLFDTVKKITYFKGKDKFDKDKQKGDAGISYAEQQRVTLQDSLHSDFKEFCDCYVKAMGQGDSTDLNLYISNYITIKEKIMSFEQMDEQGTTAESLGLEKSIDENGNAVWVGDSSLVILWNLYEERNYYKALTIE